MEGLGERGTRPLVANSEVIETFKLLGCHSLLRLTDESATDRVEDRQRRSRGVVGAITFGLEAFEHVRRAKILD